MDKTEVMKMSFANKLKGMGEATGGGQMAPMETFCITVTGYENVDAEKEQDRFVIGTRVDTKEEVRVDSKVRAMTFAPLLTTIPS
jgi:hypothetical protein